VHPRRELRRVASLIAMFVFVFTLDARFRSPRSRPHRNHRASVDKLIRVRTHFSLDNCVCSTYIRRMKRVSVFLSEPQIAALKKLSKRAGIKASELIRRFIDEGLKRS
jgi:Ribbon-helix-helix protein, copG family